MAVLSVKEKHDRRRSSNKDGKVSHTRVFLTTHDDPRDGTAVALTANDGTNRVPRPGDSYLGTTVTSIDADPVANSAVHFEVSVEYTDGDNEAFDIHPLDRPAEVQYGGSDVTEPYFMDEGDSEEVSKPVTTSAGDPFESYLERERGTLVLTVTRNEAFHDAAEADEYGNTTNRDYVTVQSTTFSPGTLKLSYIQAASAVETWQGQTVEYFKKTYTLKARREGWDDKPLDIGLNELFEVTERDNNGVERIVKKKRPIVDANGLRVTKPVPLKAGKRKVLTIEDSSPEVLTFRGYRKLSWSGINLLVV